MTRADIENAILITFLDINDLGENIEDAYKLNISIFTSKFRKRIAERINEVKDGAYGFLSWQIEESCIDTLLEYDYTEMSKQNSLGLLFSKKYHDKLISDDRMEDLC